MKLSTELTHAILQHSQAQRVLEVQVLQELWSGYGQITRVLLQGGRWDSVIVKQVAVPRQSVDSLSHQRKLRSYQIERYWYQHYSADAYCRIPCCYASWGNVLLLEDIDAAGFTLRKSRLNRQELTRCLIWLAHFHARFMGVKPNGLWRVGTYWHLATRPDELAALTDTRLKAAAAQIDARLNNCRFQTLVHGDAKSDNFCFHHDGQQVAALDFQYVGAGCGLKDVVYLLDSCLTATQCENWADALLAEYFSALQQALAHYQKQLDWAALHAEWMARYADVWADFYRFVQGWAVGMYTPSRYVSRLIAQSL